MLTNFLLPQQQERDTFRPNPEQQESSEAESFQVWEEARSRNRLVRWAGEDEDRGGGGVHPQHQRDLKLRREPTPFPKEMRAMAKRVQSMRNNSHQVRKKLVLRRKTK